MADLLDPYKGANPPGSYDDLEPPLILEPDEIAVEDPDRPGYFHAEKR